MYVKSPSDLRRSHGLKTRATGKPARPQSALNRFQLLVECADERDQREMYEQFTARGRKCRVITV
jgi:hypothetical protein